MATDPTNGPPVAELPCWPAPERNKGPLLEVLSRWFERGMILELAAGTGQHAVHFARGLPATTWQPSEVDHALLDVITVRVAQAALPNLNPPVWLDVSAPSWPLSRVDGVFSANLLHISAWHVAQCLFAGAARTLTSGGHLLTYGPYKKAGAHTSVSNADFDASLRRRNPDWGVRDIADLEATASHHQLDLVDTVSMPANNLTLVWRRR